MSLPVPPPPLCLLRLSLFLLALLAGGARAADLLAPPATWNRGLLWQVDRAGVKPSHVFGTLHVEDERVIALPAPVRKAFKGARSFSPELVPDVEGMQRFVAAMHLAPGENLRGLAGDELYDKVEAGLEAGGQYTGDLSSLKPWAAMLRLVTPPPRTGMILDRVLLDQALERKLPVHALETVDEQVEVFDGMDLAMQLSLLADAAEQQGELPAMVEELTRAWLARDLKRMWQADTGLARSSRDRAVQETFLARVLVERNARMVERMLPRLQEGGAFIAVGALHLAGDEGILARLAARGWRLKRLW